MQASEEAIRTGRAGERRHYGFSSVPMRQEVAHDGDGVISTARVESSADGLEFVDLTSIPPGATVGIHRHSMDNEEIYVIVSGEGAMTVEEETFRVVPGDVIVNNPGGQHGLKNVGAQELRMVVVQRRLTKPGP